MTGARVDRRSSRPTVHACSHGSRTTAGKPRGRAPAWPRACSLEGNWLTELREHPLTRIDPRKFGDYSLNPDHPQNEGKWKAFDMLGYGLKVNP